MKRLLRLLGLFLLLLAIPANSWAQDSNLTQQVQLKEYENGFLFNVFEIPNVEERVQLASALATSDTWICNPTDHPGELYIRPNSSYADIPIYAEFDYLRMVLKKEYEELSSLPKEDFSEIFQSWANNISADFYNFLISDHLDRANHCMDAEPFCTTDVYNFPALNSGYSWSGPNYGCLGNSPTSHHSFWYYMRVGVAGNITIKIQASFDVDFALWGPFSNETAPCPTQAGQTGMLTATCSDCPNNTSSSANYPYGNLHDCSFDAAHVEYAHVVNGQVGQYYILLITNWAGGSGSITFQKYAGNGETDCTILPPLVSNNGPYCVGGTITLTGNAQAGATYNWSGPGNWTATGQTVTRPNCTLAMAGTYTCTIHVGSQSSSANTQVQVFAQPNANFTANNACVGNPVQFNNNSTTNPANQNMSYQWNFGDGQTSNQQSPSHIYNTPGNYNVTLTVSTGGPCTSTKSQSITVSALPTPNFTANAVCQGNSTQFTNTTTTNPPGQAVTYLWDFGDGQTSTQQNPTHQFATSGNHNVTLTATSGGSCSNTKTNVVVVYPNPVANAGPDQTIQYGGVAQLNGSAGTGMFNYHWEPADKVVNPSAQSTQTIGLTESTVFTFTATHPTGGCTSSDQVSVLIEGSNMTATASASPTSICLGESSQLTATTVGGTGNYTYSWSPSIGLDNPLIANPIATPTETTTYTCTVSDGYTTMNVSTTVSINEQEYEEMDEYICPDETFSFYGQDYNQEGNYDYHTTTAQGCEKVITLHLHHYPSYDNAHTTTEYICAGESYPFHSHTYNTTGVYSETLETIHGCDSVVWLNLTVYPPNDTTLVDPSICISQTYNFHGTLYSQDGDIAYFDTIDNHGCLKVEKLVLSVGEYQMPPVEYVYECYAHDDSPSYYWDKSGQTYTQNTYDEVILPDPQGGCDYKYRLNLKFHQEFYHTETMTVCDSYDWPIVPGSHYTSTNHHIVSSVHTGGGPNFNCDSTYVLDLTVNHATESQISIPNQCDQYDWQFGWNGETYSYNEAGTYTHTIPTVHGCDSTVTMNLQLDYSPSFPKVEGHAWVVGGSEFQYTIENYAIQIHPRSTHSTDWGLYNPDGSPFNKWDLVPYDNGDKCLLYIYTFERDSIELRAHTQSTGDCACGEYTKSLWIHCSYHDVNENTAPCKADIYPNPNKGSMTLSFENMFGEVTVKVHDLTGTLVDAFLLNNSHEKHTHQYDASRLSEGMYFFTLSSKEGTITKKVIIMK